MKYLFEKKMNKKGFTLSETLASVLILILVVTIIGGGIVVVKNAYQRITLKANAQVLMSTAITKVSDELKFAENIEGTDTPTFVSGNNSYKMSFVNGDGTADNLGIMEAYATGDSTQNIQLLSTKTMTDGLVPSITYNYSSDDKLFTATIEVKKDGTTVSKQTITVRPLNE